MFSYINNLTKPIMLLIWSLILCQTGYAKELREFSSTKQRAFYNDIIDELRCLVCQNQNLADSDAKLAKDLRSKVYTMTLENKSKDEILQYMVDRYGDFVLYRPPVKTTTALLWFGPFIFAVIAVLLLVIYLRRRNQQLSNKSELSTADREHIKTLLAETDKD